MPRVLMAQNMQSSRWRTIVRTMTPISLNRIRETICVIGNKSDDLPYCCGLPRRWSAIRKLHANYVPGSPLITLDSDTGTNLDEVLR